MTFLLSWQEPLPIAKFSTKDREHNRGLQQEVLIFRYLFKEIFITLVALTTILLFIFMSNQFVQYLNRAVGGQIPAVMLMKLMMIELPTLMGLLVPLGFYVAILVAYGRLYADSEMTVLQACGYGPTQLFWHTLTMAILVAGLVALIMLWLSPFVAADRAKILRATGVQTLIQTITPGRFQSVSSGRQVFYVESMNRAHTVGKNIFLARLLQKNGQSRWDVVWAEQAYAETDPKTFEDYVVLRNGKEYEGLPGHADYRVAEFERYQARLPHPKVEIKDDLRTEGTLSLWPKQYTNRKIAAELQWRFSVPLMVLTLTMVGVPLCRVNPRSGKYAKLLPAIVFYIFYANFIFVARDWFVAGKTPAFLGMWWIHLLAAVFGLVLLMRNRVRQT